MNITPSERRCNKNRENLILLFIAALFTVATIQNHLICPLVDEWIKKI
jgi:hypothetical protein